MQNTCVFVGRLSAPLGPGVVSAQLPAANGKALPSVPFGETTWSVCWPARPAFSSMRSGAGIEAAASATPSSRTLEPCTKFAPCATHSDAGLRPLHVVTLLITGALASNGVETTTSSISQPRKPLKSGSRVSKSNRTCTDGEPIAGERSTRYSFQLGSTP